MALSPRSDRGRHPSGILVLDLYDAFHLSGQLANGVRQQHLLEKDQGEETFFFVGKIKHRDQDALRSALNR